LEGRRGVEDAFVHTFDTPFGWFIILEGSFFTFLLVCRSFVSVFINLLSTGWANIALGESIESGFAEGGNVITCWYHFFFLFLSMFIAGDAYIGSSILIYC
jgi:hypothetical protein